MRGGAELAVGASRRRRPERSAELAVPTGAGPAHVWVRQGHGALSPGRTAGSAAGPRCVER